MLSITPNDYDTVTGTIRLINDYVQMLPGSFPKSGALPTLMSVSYTHLYVYKRQVQVWGGRRLDDVSLPL